MESVLGEHYTIGWEAVPGLLALRISGFWTDEVVTRFGADLNKAVRQIRGKPFSMVADLSAAGPQPLTVVADAGAIFGEAIAGGLVRFVVIGASALLRMQVRRAAAPLEPVFVSNWAEAREQVAKAA